MQLISRISLRLPHYDQDSLERRAHYIHGLTLAADSPDQPPYLPDGPANSIAAFLLDTRQNADRYPQDWAWAQAMLRTVNLEPYDLLPAISALDGAHQFTRYGSAVAAFRPQRDSYIYRHVSDLPYAQNPHRCEFKEQFLSDLRRRETLNRFLRPVRRYRTHDELRTRAGQAVWQNHQSQQWQHCAMHTLNPVDFADAALDAHQIWITAAAWNEQGIRAAILNLNGPGNLTPKSSLTLSLLVDPIVWEQGQPQVVNGQHRICGARAAGISMILTSRE